MGIWASLLGLVLGTTVASAQDEWPQWRGPRRDGHSASQGLLKTWPAGGPKVLWKSDKVGVGYSSLAVTQGIVLTQGDLHGVEHILALDAQTGAVLWAVQPEPVAQALQARIAQEMKSYDRNGDGLVEEAEALQRMDWTALNRQDVALPGAFKALAEKRAAKLIAALDKNSDGKISWEETNGRFQEMFRTADAGDMLPDEDKLVETRTQDFFARFDADKDGQLTKKEARGSSLNPFFNQIDKTKPSDEQLSQDEVSKYLLRFEGGQDGLLSAPELTQFFEKTAAGKDGQLTLEELRGILGGYRNGQGDGPRGTPTVEGDRVYTEGGNGDLTCLELRTGKTLWHVDLVKSLGGGRPGWGYSESPLIVDELLFVTPGGNQGTLAAINKQTGAVVWRSKDVKQGAHYSSPVYAEIAGIKQIVQFARDSCFGVRLDNGGKLWEYSNANNGTANCCTPLVQGEFVFASSAYGTGGGLAKVTNVTSDSQKAEEVYFSEKMAVHHGGLVRIGEYMYGFGNGGLICMNYLTGQIIWANQCVGKGSLCYADGMLYCLGERHQMALVEATPEGYREHGRFPVENLGRPSWAHPVVAGGRLYLRNQNELTVYDLKAQ